MGREYLEEMKTVEVYNDNVLSWVTKHYLYSHCWNELEIFGEKVDNIPHVRERYYYYADIRGEVNWTLTFNVVDFEIMKLKRIF